MDVISLTETSSTSACNIQYLEYDNAREHMFPCSTFTLHTWNYFFMAFKTESIIMFHL
jgi:hypothetical protein